jgi:hypothetical protein
MSKNQALFQTHFRLHFFKILDHTVLVLLQRIVDQPSREIIAIDLETDKANTRKQNLRLTLADVLAPPFFFVPASRKCFHRLLLVENTMP